MYIKLRRNGTRNQEYSFVCVCVCVGWGGGGGGWGGGEDGRGDSLILNCVWGGGGGAGTVKVIHLFQTALIHSYLLFILTTQLKTLILADDTSLFIIVDNPIDAARKLNSDLETIHQWAIKWIVTFNPSKTESLLLSRKHNSPRHPEITMNQQPIAEVNSHKHLGITLNGECSWHEHLSELKSKAWQRINIMRKLKFILDRQSLQAIYFSFIRLLLEYADVVWDNCTQHEANELEKIQTKAARIVTGATRLVSIDSLRTETGWETLASRRHKHKLLLFFKMKSELPPSYLTSLVPPSGGANSAYNLRNANSIETVQANSQLYYNSFLPSVIRSWNELPQETRDSYNIASFKRHLNADIVLPPDYYNAGKRLGQIYHTRLRTRCSSLNQHIFSKNITQSPLCICGEVEDSKHFFLECSLYKIYDMTC